MNVYVGYYAENNPSLSLLLLLFAIIIIIIIHQLHYNIKNTQITQRLFLVHHLQLKDVHISYLFCS